MSIAVDANVLIFATNTESPHHEAAVRTLDEAMMGPEPVYVFWPVALAYIRVVTHLTLLGNPLSVPEALNNVERLLSVPNVHSGSETSEFMSTLRAVAVPVAARGKLIHDAHLVALMRQYGVSTLWTNDRDFRKFDGIRVVDPFQN